MFRHSVLGVLIVVLLAAVVDSGCVHGSASETHASTAAPPIQQSATAAPPSSIFHPDPASACSSVGGTYLGDLKCQMPDGSIAQIHTSMVGAETKISEIPVPPKSPQAWALTTTAIMFELNGAHHDLLGGVVITPDNMESRRQLLSQWWNVSNRGQLLDTLRWLQFEGHRAYFDELGRQVDAMNEAQFIATEAGLAGDPQQLHRVQLVRQNHLALGQPGILAWDLVRYIALCRWGYVAGYLSSTEAWDYIMPAARRLQETFGSWQALQNNYMIGREFWSLQQTQENGERYRVISDRFLQDPNSPWNVNPWRMDLGVAMPLRVTEK
jgi:hypothetical protein